MFLQVRLDGGKATSEKGRFDFSRAGNGGQMLLNDSQNLLIIRRLGPGGYFFLVTVNTIIGTSQMGNKYRNIEMPHEIKLPSQLIHFKLL